MQASMAALRTLEANYQSPTSLRGLLLENHPAPPPELTSYYSQQVSTQAPLASLCVLDFEIVQWPFFYYAKMDWLVSLQDEPIENFVNLPLYLNFRSYLVSVVGRIFGNPAWKQHHGVFTTQCGSGYDCCVGSPDMVIVNSEWEVVMVGVMDMMPTSRPALARLYSYLLLSGSSLGVVSSYEHTVCCMKIGTRLLVSSPVDRSHGPMLGIGYMLASAGHLQERYRLAVIPTPLPRSSLHLDYAKRLFEECSTQQQVKSVEKMVQGLGSGLGFGDVEEIKFVSCGLGGLSCVVRGVYKGRRVVVKTKDLSALTHNCEDFNRLLSKSVRELDVYARLHKLQGVCIPRLLSYGFIRGGMIFYQIMSDEGNGAGVASWTPGNAAQVQEVISQARNVLLALHDRGVVYNGLQELCDIVVFVGSRGELRAKLVGFGNALVRKYRRTCPSMDEDLMKLNECKVCLEELCHRGAP